jgi:hypothetical protein
VTAAEEIDSALARLEQEQPEMLLRASGPGSEPPYGIALAAWGADMAAELHDRFGDDVDLTVGFLPYPPERASREQPAASFGRANLLDSGVATVELDGPASVRSGYSLTHSLLVRNRSRAWMVVLTNGRITASVVDPATGEVVGGYAGAQTLPGVRFQVAPGDATRIPLLVGTASVTARLGYAVPPGQWGLQALLDLRDEGRRLTPVLPLTVTV